MKKSEQEWRQQLNELEYHVLRESGTERPFSGKYVDFDQEGVYKCRACGHQLFSSQQKFHSGCGWPAFDDELKEAAIQQIRDTSHGMIRTEVRCSNCDSHLGHIFEDGPTATSMRYCINSVCLDFEENQSE